MSTEKRCVERRTCPTCGAMASYPCRTRRGLRLLHPHWRRLVKQIRRDLDLENGRRLASQRDDLIAQGIDPAALAIPVAPTESGETHE